jgi:hypothetical protein
MPIVEKLHDFPTRERVMIGQGWEDKTAWDYIQERDKKLLGDIITNKEEQRRWSRAIFLAGGLPYIWDRAEDFRKVMYDALELRRGDKVLIFGEMLDACGFLEEVKKRLDGEGEVHAHEMAEMGRGLVTATGGKGPGVRGPAQWQYAFTEKYANEYFDAVFVPQGAHHNLDWAITSRDVARVLKKGRRVVMGEAAIGLSPDFVAAVHSDVHLEALWKKIRVGMGSSPETVWEFTQPSPEDLEKAFNSSGLYTEMHSFVWKGMILFHARKM